VRADGLLRAAVANNAGWCDAVCRSHGYPGEFTPRTWISSRHDLPFYPNAITLSPDATTADTQAARDPDRAYGVKDSFACLDLAPAGLAPLFDADWVAWDPAAGDSFAGHPVAGHPVAGDPVPEERRPAESLRWQAVSGADELAGWEAAWAADGGVAGLFRPDLLADPCCAFLGCYQDGALAAGAIAYIAAGVTGISNLFRTGLAGEVSWPGTLWRSAVRAVAAVRPGLPVVGYESGEDLAAARDAGGRVIGPLRVWIRGSAVP
jgi:hypothetical protein